MKATDALAVSHADEKTASRTPVETPEGAVHADDWAGWGEKPGSADPRTEDGPKTDFWDGWGADAAPSDPQAERDDADATPATDDWSGWGDDDASATSRDVAGTPTDAEAGEDAAPAADDWSDWGAGESVEPQSEPAPPGPADSPETMQPTPPVDDRSVLGGDDSNAPEPKSDADAEIDDWANWGRDADAPAGTPTKNGADANDAASADTPAEDPEGDSWNGWDGDDSPTKADDGPKADSWDDWGEDDSDDHKTADAAPTEVADSGNGWDGDDSPTKADDGPKADSWDDWGEDDSDDHKTADAAPTEEPGADSWNDWGRDSSDTSDVPAEKPVKKGFHSDWRDRIGKDSGEGDFSDWDTPEADDADASGDKDGPEVEREWERDGERDSKRPLPLKPILAVTSAALLLAALLLGFLQYQRVKAHDAAVKAHTVACRTMTERAGEYKRLQKSLNALGVEIDDAKTPDCAKTTTDRLERATKAINVGKLRKRLARAIADKWTKEDGEAVDKAVAANPDASKDVLDQLKALKGERPTTIRERESLDARLKSLSDKAASEQKTADDRKAEEKAKADKEAADKAAAEAAAQAQAQAEAQAQAQQSQRQYSYTPRRQYTQQSTPKRSTQQSTPKQNTQQSTPQQSTPSNPGNTGAEM